MGDVQISNIKSLMEKIGVGDVALTRIAGQLSKIQESTGDLTLNDIKKVMVAEGVSKSQISEVISGLDKLPPKVTDI